MSKRVIAKKYLIAESSIRKWKNSNDLSLDYSKDKMTLQYMEVKYHPRSRTWVHLLVYVTSSAPFMHTQAPCTHHPLAAYGTTATYTS